jgi:alkylhydroperoxidase family enzyme
MSEHDVATEGQDLLRRLARHDERSLRAVLAPRPESGSADEGTGPFLDRTTRGLVRLAALLAIGACTESLRWAVELASATGADDEAVTSALIAAGLAAGSAQLVASAPRLALALGVELEPVEDEVLLTQQAGF